VASDNRIQLDTAKKIALMPNANSTNAMSILTLVEKPAAEQISAIERGFPSESLDQIAKMLGLSKQRIIGSLKFAQRTVSQREKTGRRFTLEESERMLRVLRAHRIVREAFTTDEAVAQWLNTPDRSLGGKSPLDMLATDVGAATVENLARAMIHGVPI
jgi:putative toxin-antitoxin system antitoxin component (TIGR02293 family)